MTPTHRKVRFHQSLPRLLEISKLDKLGLDFLAKEAYSSVHRIKIVYLHAGRTMNKNFLQTTIPNLKSK